MVAAAAIVVVAVAGTTLLDERRRHHRRRREPAADAALETLVRNAQADGGTVTTLSRPRARTTRPRQSSPGSTTSAPATPTPRGTAMGDVSQAHFGSQAEFEDLMTDLAEGYGAWSAAEPDEVLVTPVAAGDDGTIAVVTLLGTVEQEGTPRLGPTPSRSGSSTATSSSSPSPPPATSRW